MRIRHPFRRQAYTLVELAMVLLILSTVAALYVAHRSAVVSSQERGNTQAIEQRIQDALMRFREANCRLPCPADPGLTVASHGLGLESGSPGTCGGGNVRVGNNVAFGEVPFKALGIDVHDIGESEANLLDDWGHKFAYAVNLPATASNACASIPLHDTATRITIYDGSGTPGSVIASNALYAVVSYGPTGHGGGHGAYLPSGTQLNTGATNQNALYNCKCNTDLSFNASYISQFVQGPPTQNSAAPTTSAFENIVVYATRAQLATPAELSGTPETCGSSSSASSSADTLLHFFA